jgi:transposase
MITQERLVEIHVLHRQGLGIRAIAKKLNVSRNTVRQYLRNVAKTPHYKPRQARPSKLEPFHAYLRQRIEAAKPHWIPATVLFREIQAQGYQGKEGIVKNYIRPFKPKSDAEPVVRFETPPGQQMQVDFTTISRGGRKIKAFVATLGYSRATYVRFSEHERQQDWLDGIRGALQFFGGVPQQILFDNAKCIMIERDAFGEGQHRWNSSLLNLSRDYGFQLRACRPYRAKTKGKVERFNGYLKRSFITPLAATLKQSGLILDVDTANGKIGAWLADVAQQRIHGTTGEKPQVLLEKERLYLLPLPALSENAKGISQSNNHRVTMPVESLQHPLSSYDQLLEIRL